MWLPEQLPALSDTLDVLGLETDVNALADLDSAPLGAVVSLGGCSASFVSEAGLVVTNHHCAVGALQHNSTEERNVLQEGFAAPDRASEIWAGPGSRVYVTESIEDVTARVIGAVPDGATDAERFAAIDTATKELIAECEADPGMRCSVPAFHGGGSFRLVRQLEIEDVRIVFAPPSMIGFYGGDVDNWMWPRHTGDFAFFRAYVSPDGSPAPYAVENVPYRPSHHLEIRTTELDDGDFVMVAGYPGRTYRQRTGSEMEWARDVTYPWNIDTMEAMLAILAEAGEADPEASVRTQSFVFGLENYLKNNRGMLDGFQRSGAVERSLERDLATRETLVGSYSGSSENDSGSSENDSRSSELLEAVDELEAMLEAGRDHHERDALLGWMGWGVDLLDAANTALWLAHQRALPDAQRDQGYQERDWPRIAERFGRLDATFHAGVDARMLAYFMERLDAVDDPDTDAVVELFLELGEAGRDFEAAATAIYGQTLLSDTGERAALLEASVEDITLARDPLLRLAAAMYPLRLQLHRERQERDGGFSRLRPQYIAAVRAAADGPVYPDANSTLRVTFGRVLGYDGPDAVWYRPFTTVEGVLEKHTGTAPFDAPEELRTAIESGEWGPYGDSDLDSVAVNFLSTLDTTGGNSGSVTLDSEGRLCGLLFDGNYESMASDWVFDPVSTRSIHVGAQYMLWVLDRVYGQAELLRELGVEPAFAN